MTMGLEELLLAAVRVQSLLVDRGWRFCFIGGIAIQRWGEPRFTRDIDLTLLTGFGNEDRVVDQLLELKGQLEALAKLDGLVATVKRRLEAKL